MPENHVVVGELMESKSSQKSEIINTASSMNGETSWNPDSESSQAAGGFSVAFSLSVIQVVLKFSEELQSHYKLTISDLLSYCN